MGAKRGDNLALHCIVKRLDMYSAKFELTFPLNGSSAKYGAL